MVIATFTVDYHQTIRPDGTLTQPLPKGLDDNALVELYRVMNLVRVFDTKAINLQRTGKLGTYASILGQEAVSVAIGHTMRADDVLVPYYRDQGAQYLRNIAFSKILQYWGGDERGSDFANKEDFPICVPIANQSIIATGVATAIKYRQQKRAVVTTIGEGGTSKGDFYEALNVAGAWNLPMVFVVNNNQWAISVPRSIQTHTQTIAQKAIAAGFSGEQVDGNDIVAMEERMHLALEKARSGGGPTLIEAITYRLGDHTTADDASRYRPKDELAAAWSQEPFVRLRAYLTAQKMWDERKEETLLQECRETIDKEVADYLNIAPAPATDMIDYMYATWPESLQEQRETLSQFGSNSHE